MKESTRVLLALIAAIFLGVLIAASHNASLIRAADAIAPIGTLWVNAIRMTVIPLVVCHALNFPTLMKGPRLVGAATSQ
jgi:Na+/H+-dicarboxylate symporter